MTYLFGNRANEVYTYRRVDWTTWQEGADIGDVVDGSVELSAFSDLKGVCSFDYMGTEAPEQDGLVRIYYSFTDDYGERAEYMIGTFIVCYASNANVADYVGDECVGMRVSGKADGYSVLKVLSDRIYGMPFTISAGQQPVQVAVSLINGLGLRVDVQDASSYALKSDYTFEPDDSYLTIVNWCMTAAGFAAVSPDPSGAVVVKRYVDPTDRAPVATFANDDESIMYPEVEVENDWQSTPNVVRAFYSTEDVAIYAYAKNIKGSKASLDSRGGRELTLFENVSELDGSTSAQMLSNLKAHARTKLLDNSSEIERVRLSHPYIPIYPNDPIRVEYADKVWSGSVTNIKMALSPSTKCDTEIRRFVPSTITVQTDGAVLWEVS